MDKGKPASSDFPGITYVLAGIALAVLVGSRIVLPSMPSPDVSQTEETHGTTTVFLFGIWALAYYFVATTPPVGRSSNALLALGITVFGVITSSAAGLLLLPFLWWRRRSARILNAIMEDEAYAAQPEISAAPVRRKRKPKKANLAAERTPGKGDVASRTKAETIGRLVALAANHGSLTAPENLFPYLNRPKFEQEMPTASERLIENWPESPLVTLGWDAGVAVALAPREQLNDDNKRRALQNLRARPERAEWEEVRVPSPDGEIELFARVGDDRTASDLIDPEFLQAAFERCGKATVFFAVPTRQSMVMASHPDPVAKMAAARLEDSDLDEEPVSACLFAFDGQTELVPMIPQGLSKAISS